MAAPSPVFANDDDAVRASMRGEQAGFNWLMERHREPVFRFIRAQVRDEDEALDITQECFVSAFAALHRYDRARPFRTWLLAIAVNKSRDWARRRMVRRFFTFAAPLEDAGSVSDSRPDPESAAASAEAVDRIHAALAALPANLREPLLLCTIDDMSQAEAAEVLGINRKAVETRIYRARAKLAEMLEGRSAFP